MSNPRLVFLVLALSLLAPSCSKSPPEPKEPIPGVTITVLDYLGEPAEDETVHLFRKHVKRSFSDYATKDRIAEVVTDQAGKVTLEEARDGDWVWVYTKDFRFEGRVDLVAPQSEYTLHLDKFRSFLVEHDGSKPDVDVEKDFQRAKAAMEAIGRHFIMAQEREFGSLKHYVELKVITKSDADAFLRIMPLDDGSENASYIRGIRNRVRVTGYEDPIQLNPGY